MYGSFVYCVGLFDDLFRQHCLMTVPAGLWRFHSVFPGQPRTTLAFLHLETVVQNAFLEAELLGLTSTP